ncbi:UNKNOWN [Stylonychia lemnae]|uniref:Uncharacterized protein n=1 Tax=Stylonychia lemnae TaxID=5949 RepID=A0A077ZNA6_STYLE|nr:UNKNOWN [Stylonychia lemnae]|eukprot:CDW71403.1 UNKNOWN [Stylonychia lemnae]
MSEDELDKLPFKVAFIVLGQQKLLVIPNFSVYSLSPKNRLASQDQDDQFQGYM